MLYNMTHCIINTVPVGTSVFLFVFFVTVHNSRAISHRRPTSILTYAWFAVEVSHFSHFHTTPLQSESTAQ